MVRPPILLASLSGFLAKNRNSQVEPDAEIDDSLAFSLALVSVYRF
jgi:hypothetical protein